MVTLFVFGATSFAIALVYQFHCLVERQETHIRAYNARCAQAKAYRESHK